MCLILVQKSSSDATMTGLLNNLPKKRGRRNAPRKTKKARLEDVDSLEVDAASPPGSTGRIVGHYVLKLNSTESLGSKTIVRCLMEA